VTKPIQIGRYTISGKGRVWRVAIGTETITVCDRRYRAVEFAKKDDQSAVFLCRTFNREVKEQVEAHNAVMAAIWR